MESIIKMRDQIMQLNAIMKDRLAEMNKAMFVDIERWAPIVGYENYQISNYGRVRNNKTNRIMKQSVLRDGYLVLSLCKKGKLKNHRVHRLVASVFCLNPDDKPHVDHIDCNKLNNNYVNLRWSTIPENNMNRTKQAGTSSKYIGVCLNKRCNKWQANFKLNGKLKHLGYFTNEEDAARCYDRAAKERNPVFFKLNFP
jgi:hypothetical protein